MIYNYDSECSEIRIDKYISEKEPLLSRSAIVSIIENGGCKVNGKQVQKNYKLKIGDNVDFTVPEAKPTDILPQNIPLDVRYEDDDVIVINKSRGMVVHPSHGHDDNTLVNALLYYAKDSLSGINGELRPGIVHRIDKNTSGLLLIAKNDFTHARLAEQIEKHSLTREYEAVVNGAVKENGIVNAPIGRHQNDRKKMCVTTVNSKEAVTHYEIIENYGNSTHLRLRLETGRTHQIRVHLSYIGHPVSGDDVYGNGKPKWLGGQCLHARKLGFIHPRSGEYIEVTSELPEYFIKMLNEIKRSY